MRYLRLINVVALLACLIAGCTLTVGCGDANSPQAAVEEIVRAVRGGETQTVEGFFDDTGSLYFFEEALVDQAMPAIGEVKETGDDSATVEVLINSMRPDEGGFIFTMHKAGDTWKVSQVTINMGE